MSLSFLNTRDHAIAHRKAVQRFQKEQRCGRDTGNYCLTTSAGFRLAVSSFDPATIKKYLTVEMGIGAEVIADADGIAIGFGKYSHHSHATVTRDLQGAFRMMSLTHEDGRQVIKVMGYSTADAHIARITP